MFDVKKLHAIQVSLASPEQIRSWSHGEVTKPETINYRSQKPEMDGLYCEKIFGPSKDYECHCGKYRKMRYAGMICPNCGVEVISKEVRRERMGHIELASPCCHIWYLKGIPSRISLLLGISPKDLEEVAYYASRVCLHSDLKAISYKQVISEKNGRGIFIAAFEEILTLVDENGNKKVPEGSEDEARIHDQISKLDPSSGVVFDFATNAYLVSKYSSTQFGIGGEAIKKLLSELNLDEEAAKIKEAIRRDASKGKNAYLKYTKKLEVIEAFRHSNNKPEWMVLDVIPVIPPDLRPMLQLDGGRFATSDLNDLYRRVISRNKRLKDMISMNTPEVILINEKRMLQEAVDALIDNGRRNKPVSGPGGRPLKSLSSALKGKQGRFRQNLLGKRVDFSGRSVIAVGPYLKMYECGLPREMAIQLLRPFIVCEIMKRKKDCTHKAADHLVDSYDPIVFDIVEEIISKHPVLLNRAPTLHRLGIQAFQPRLVDGRAIRLHPLVCTGFNADFDGDQMAVHVPLSKAAQEEALHLMLASNNILGPKDGKPIVTPSQDMVLGNYYLTIEETKEDFTAKSKSLEATDKKEAERFLVYANSEGKVFASIDDVLVAYQTKQIHLHNRIAIIGSALGKVNFTEEQNKSYLVTSVGKIIFNLIFPNDFPYINEVTPENLAGNVDKYFLPRGSDIKSEIAKRKILKPFKKGDLGKLINKIFQDYDRQGNPKTSAVLDKLKDQGFQYATVAGFTVSISDIHIVEGKQKILDQGDNKVKEIEDMYAYGLLTEKERHKQICDVWSTVLVKVQETLLDQFNKDVKNPIFMMMDSGARGNKSHITQLAGMRGLMGNTSGGTNEIPVKASFREGMSVSEFFAATHGARKGGTDTALRTADSGYLTRRLVDVSQDVIVREEDCHTDQGFEVSEIRNTAENSIIVKLYDRLVGRYALNDVINPATGEVIVKGNTMIQEDQAKAIVDAGITHVTIRSLFTCKTKDGVCVHCYGRNMATGREVQIGEAVGIMAAQSIGEPGTQLTMRTFHTGGVAGSDITQGLPRVQELFEARTPKGEAVISKINGEVKKIEEKNSVFYITVDSGLESIVHETPYGATLRVKKGDKVKAGGKLTEGAVKIQDLLSYAGVESVERYLLKEVQKVYSSQEIGISDKHIEVIVKQMLRKVHILDSGDTDLICGTNIDASAFTEANEKALLEGKRPAYCQPLVLGITKSALGTQSFLSAASFQETTRVLTDAAIKGKKDILHGLKENVITGHLIPAGRGLLSEEAEIETVSDFTVEDTMAKVKDRYIEAHDRKIAELREKVLKSQKN